MSDDEIRMARLHLRLGMPSLARAELEDLHRRDALDVDGWSALAEARWRAGDLAAASTAAGAHVDGGGTSPVAFAIMAEAAAADGRPTEARTQMDRLGAIDAAAIDALFAGMPRRAYWPTAPAEAHELTTLFGEPDRGIVQRGSRTPGRVTERPTAAGASTETARESAAVATPAGSVSSARREASRTTASRSVPGPREVMESTEPGLWGEAARAGAGAAERGSARRRGLAEVNPLTELSLARAELPDQPDRALLRLALLLRMEPTLAPAVLDAIMLRREPAAAILRGDAERLLGRHLEAEVAFSSAAETLDR